MGGCKKLDEGSMCSLLLQVKTTTCMSLCRTKNIRLLTKKRCTSGRVVLRVEAGIFVPGLCNMFDNGYFEL